MLLFLKLPALLYVMVSQFSFLQSADGTINIVEILMHVLAVGVSAGVIYKGTDFISWLFWLVSGNVLPGREKARLSILLAFFTTPVVYGLLLVDGGLITYDYRGMLAVFATSFLCAWAVYQRSKYKDQSGEVIDTGATQSIGYYQGAEEIPDPEFFQDAGF